MNTNLYVRVRGEGEPLLLLHGLFGSSDNLGSIASALAKSYETHAIDLRNHGKSFHDADMTYDLMAGDVLAYMDEQGLDEAIVLGHSMGGKVAMTLALTQPKRVKALLVADIAPVRYPAHHREIFKGLFELCETPVLSRKQADQGLSAHIEESGIRQFLLKNLLPLPEGGFTLKINLPAIFNNYEHIMAGQKSDQAFEQAVLFIAGEKSDYIQADHKEIITALFPNASMRIIPGASHWLHAEKPEIFISICERFLKRID
jgi:esterase